MNNVRLCSCLDLMLSEEDLTWTIHREVLQITTATAAQELLETRVYDVADLADSSEPGYTDIDSLIELITTIISPECWDEVGGEGAIQIIEGNGIQAISVLQSFHAHEEIKNLLAALRTHLPQKEDGKGKDAGDGKSKVATEEEAVRQALRKKVDLNFTETSLTDVVGHLEKLLGIEIYLHKRSLGEEGLDIETPISFRISGISAAAAMDLMLRDLDLTYMIKDNHLLILTSCAEQELARNTKVYDVADLVGDYEGLDCLVGVIASAIRPESWDAVGGEGSIESFDNAGMRAIVVNQTQRVQGEIEKFLADLRKIQREFDDEQPLPGGMGPRPGGPSMGMPVGPFGMSGQQFTRQRTRKSLPVKADPARDALVKGNNQFAFDLYAKLREDKPGKNVFFSPMSISTAMAMLQAGVRGKTAEEIARTMHFTLPPERLHPACQSLLEISQSSNVHEVHIANRLWAQQDYKFLDGFLNITTKHYGTTCGLVDFVGNREEAAREINSWVTHQTMGRIRGLVGPDLLDQYTRLVLANAVYFKGQWQMPFQTRNNKAADFFAEDDKKPIIMMSMTDHMCRYTKIEDVGVQILEKPYDSSFELSMTILLPNREPGSMAKLEAALTEEKMATWTKKLQGQTVKVHLPKFRLETDYSLKKHMSELGMGSAFNGDPNVADFSGMDGTRDLFLQFFLHKTCIEVDELGTEAAAATMGGFGGGGMMPSEPPEFRADHPFVFLIRDNRTGSILFLGRFCCPEENTVAGEMPRGGGMF